MTHNKNAPEAIVGLPQEEQEISQNAFQNTNAFDSQLPPCPLSRVKGSFIVVNEKGLHTRPSTELVKCASSYKCQVTLFYQQFTVNAKSLLGILMLAATRGSKIRIEAVGEDAEAAVNSLQNLAKNKFNVSY